MPFKSEDVAWAAGLFEGEGTINTGKSYYVNGEKRARKTPQITIRIGMTDIEPLERFAAIFGGSVTGPYKDKRKDWYKPYWFVSVNTTKLECIIEDKD